MAKEKEPDKKPVSQTVGEKVGNVLTREKMIPITFRENRKFDLHVGRNIVTFGPRKTKSIPVSWMKHRDFEQARKYFIIKGV